mgnify:CR=1 FL=1
MNSVVDAILRNSNGEEFELTELRQKRRWKLDYNQVYVLEKLFM